MAVRRSRQACALGLCALAEAAVGGCGEPRTVEDPCRTFALTVSIVVEYCGAPATPCELVGAEACAGAELADYGHPCTQWDVFANNPGRCVLVLTADGQEYSAEVELVEVQECRSKYRPADGGTVVRLGPDCADAGSG